MARVEGARPAHHDAGGGTPPLFDPPLHDHRGWYAPGRLPHFDSPEVPQAVTFRLCDALPRAIAETRAGEGNAAYRRRIETMLDAGRGACLLGDPVLAGVVVAALQHGDGRSYDLHAYAWMPNHVHVLMTQRAMPAAGRRRSRKVLGALAARTKTRRTCSTAKGRRSRRETSQIALAVDVLQKRAGLRRRSAACVTADADDADGSDLAWRRGCRRRCRRRDA